METFARRVQLTLVVVLFFLFGLLILSTISMASLTQRSHLQEVYLVNETAFTSFYGADYPCTPMHCLVKSSTSQFIFTGQGHSFLLRMELPLIFGSILLILLIFTLSKSISSGLITLGSLFTTLGLFYFSNYVLQLFVRESLIFDFQKAIFFIYEPIKIITLCLLVIGLLLILGGWYVRK